MPSRIAGDCDIEIAVAEGAIDTVWCFLAVLYIGFQFCHLPFAFFKVLFRFSRLLDFEVIKIFNVFSGKKRKGDKHHSPCKVIDRINVKVFLFGFLISFFNVCIFTFYVK